MSKLIVNHIYKSYSNQNGNSENVLNDISIEFPSTGLISIFGKSGCGKSTLLNIIGLIDYPDSGEVLLDGNNILKYKKKQKQFYYNQQVGFLFQNYNLLDDFDCYYNVALPSLMAGKKYKSIIKSIDKMSEYVGISKEILCKKINQLSGGEKQRVSFLRAIINQPMILLCDEPTGALDDENGKMLSLFLKKYSERHLVILVSHNEKIVNDVSDQIIYLDDGKIKIIKHLNECKINLPYKDMESFRYSEKFVDKIVYKNTRRRLKRNILSALGIFIGYTASLLVIGFNSSNSEVIERESRKQFDYGVCSVSKEISKTVNNSALSIVKTTRPTLEEIKSCDYINDNFHIEPSFDAIFPQNIDIKYENTSIEGVLYSPIYCFDNQTIDASLLNKGKMVKDEKNEVLINNFCYEKIKNTIGTDPLGIRLNVRYLSTYKILPLSLSDDYIDEEFIYEKKVRIVGVVNELQFMQSAKIYYSYIQLCNELSNQILNNYSSHISQDISWYERIYYAVSNENISSYCWKLFLKDKNNTSCIAQAENYLPNRFILSSNGLLIEQTFTNLISSMGIGMDLFLIIALIGTVLIVGIVSFSSYSDDKKRSAILTSLGAKDDSIKLIYVFESLIVSLAGLVFAFCVSPLLSLCINTIVYENTGIGNVINIPFSSFLGKPFLLPLLLIISIVFISVFSTIIPIKFSKRISVKDELQSL